MDILPIEIVSDMLSRLPIRSLLRCRCVSKTWLALTRDPVFVQQHLDRSSGRTQPPSFILTTTIANESFSFRTQLSLLQSDKPQNFNCRDVSFSQPDFHEFRVAGSSNGLLCLVHRFNGCLIYICNPCLGRFMKLPPLPVNPYMRRECDWSKVVVGFGHNPTKSEYKVMFMMFWTKSGVYQAETYVCTLGNGHWRFLNARTIIINSGPHTQEATLNGILHWATHSNEQPIISFDIDREAFDYVPCAKLGLVRLNHRLGVLNGFLAATKFVSDHQLEIWMMKNYGVEESWIRCLTICLTQFGQVSAQNVKILRYYEGGEVLFLLKNRVLISYNPQTKSFRKQRINGLPSWFDATTYTGSLVLPTTEKQQTAL